jgi:acyl-CoA dehydrogenase
MTSGRLADAFGTLYLGYACLWYYDQHRHVEGIDALFEHAMETLLKQNQTALYGVADNFPVPGVGAVMKAISFPFGPAYAGPSDKMVAGVAQAITTPTGVRDLLSQGVFISDSPDDRIRKLNDIFPQSVEADKVVAAAKKAKRALTTEEQALVDKVTAVVNDIVQVDSFDKLGIEKFVGDDYIRPALRHTKFEHLKAPVPTA